MKPISDAAFYVKDGAGREYRVYTDGRTEGFDRPMIVINKIPLLVSQAYYDGTQAMESAS